MCRKTKEDMENNAAGPSRRNRLATMEGRGGRGRRDSAARVCSISFTWNNPSGNEIELPGCAKYIVWKREMGESITEHLHGFIRLKTQMTFTMVGRFLPHCHIELARISNACRDYCMKHPSRIDGPWEHGVWVQSGKRFDLEKAKHSKVWDDKEGFVGGAL